MQERKNFWINEKKDFFFFLITESAFFTSIYAYEDHTPWIFLFLLLSRLFL